MHWRSIGSVKVIKTGGVIMSTKDNLERIANALDGGGDFGQGTVNEVGYLERIARYIEENGTGGGGSGSSDIFVVKVLTGNPPSQPSATFAEMKEALDAGKILVLKYLNLPEEYGNQYDVYHFDRFYEYGTSTSTSISFIRTYGSGASTIYSSCISCNIENTWSKVDTGITK